MEVCVCNLHDREKEEIEAAKCMDCGWPLTQEELDKYPDPNNVLNNP